MFLINLTDFTEYQIYQSFIEIQDCCNQQTPFTHLNAVKYLPIHLIEWQAHCAETTYSTTMDWFCSQRDRIKINYSGISDVKLIKHNDKVRERCFAVKSIYASFPKWGIMLRRTLLE
jgi:hypothetical protein